MTSVPEFSFASDNAAGVHPAIMESLAEANHGSTLAYGYDPFTARADEAFNEVFGRQVDTYYAWNGTGANVLALACSTMANGARWTVLCSEASHIHVDETGAPERMVGVKIHDLATSDGKITPESVEAACAVLGDEHHPQPGTLSLTQSTESGTMYSPDEIGALCEVAHRHGLFVHLDGARIANATAALGGDLHSFTVEAGVDVITFGGTKNGMMYGEAVVFLNPDLARPAKFVRKQLGQLPSKMRYIAAQFSALLTDDLWLTNAGHANAMAARLYERLAAATAVTIPSPPAVNAVFAVIKPAHANQLREVTEFYDWDTARHLVRWMTAWNTSSAQIDIFCHHASQLLPLD